MQRVAVGQPIRATTINTLLQATESQDNVFMQSPAERLQKGTLYPTLPAFTVTMVNGVACVSNGLVYIGKYPIVGDTYGDMGGSITDYKTTRKGESGTAYITVEYNLTSTQGEGVLPQAEGVARIVWSEEIPTQSAASAYSNFHVVKLAEIVTGDKEEGNQNANAPRYVKIFHRGNIYIAGTGQAEGEMPFDVSLVEVTPANNGTEGEGDGEAPEPKTCLKIKGGRVFLADAKYAAIPDKEPQADNPQSLLEVSAGYVMLSVYYNADGTLKYRYSIESSPPGTAVTPQEETSESSSTEGEGGNESDG